MRKEVEYKHAIYLEIIFCDSYKGKKSFFFFFLNKYMENFSNIVIIIFFSHREIGTRDTSGVCERSKIPGRSGFNKKRWRSLLPAAP